MTKDDYIEIYKYYKTHIPIRWLRMMIRRKGKFKINVTDIGKYFGRIGKDPEIIYRSIKKVLKEDRIIIDADKYGSIVLKFDNTDLHVEPVIKNIVREDQEKFHEFLKDNKLYDDNSRYLLCPICNRYSVEFSTSSFDESDKKWWCSHCLEVVIYRDYHLDISDKDKYHIYKLWGADALSVFTNKSTRRTIEFVASYFKYCCTSKKDKCLYFDFFKGNIENQKKGEKDENIEGDVIDERSEERSEERRSEERSEERRSEERSEERSKMGIVRRDARSK